MITLMPAAGGIDDRLMMVEVMGRDADDIQPGLLIHIHGCGIALLRIDLPFVPELLKSLRVDVGHGEQFRIRAAPVAGRVGVGPAPQAADGSGADDTDSDFGF